MGDNKDTQSSAERAAAIEECAQMLAREYPDNANTNAFCAAIRSLAALGEPQIVAKSHPEDCFCDRCHGAPSKFSVNKRDEMSQLAEYLEQHRLSDPHIGPDDCDLIVDALRSSSSVSRPEGK